MFQKVLIAEEFDIIYSGLKATLEEIEITSTVIVHASYWDEAFMKLKKGVLNNSIYNLLICDLVFLRDHKSHEITSGKDFIKRVREEFPALKIIVFSDEDKSFIIQDLHKNFKINAYVLKDRDGQKELKKALHHMHYSEEFYISKELKGAIHPRKEIKISEYDIFLIKCLSRGFSQEDISLKLKKKRVSPSSTSAIEKRLKFLKENFNANNPAHLVALAKDLGVV
jgi:DNA-binding NarL/FixJ family response regulator